MSSVELMNRELDFLDKEVPAVLNIMIGLMRYFLKN